MIVCNDAAVGAYLCDMAGNVEYSATIGVVDTSGVVAAVGYDYFTGYSIRMSVAARRLLFMNQIGADFLWAAFDYPFNQLGCEKVFSTVPALNDKSLVLGLRLGFAVDAYIPDVYITDGTPEGQFMLGLHKRDCRWLRRVPKTVRGK